MESTRRPKTLPPSLRRQLTPTLLACAALAFLATSHALAQSPAIPLHDNWKLQSSCIAKSSGEQISSLEYKPTGWISTTVPNTVMGAQVEAGIFPDPYFGTNLRNIPGNDYPFGKIFGRLPMPENSPYRCSWWYRTEFMAPGPPASSTWLHFDGINYRANLWLNGHQIASTSDIDGAYRSYDLDVSPHIARGHKNVLAVEAFAETEHDLGTDFIDWNPTPGDKNMGLWRGVSVSSAGPVTLRNPAVATHFPNDDLSKAELTLTADLANHLDHPVTATVSATIGKIHLQKEIPLAAKEAKVVHLTPQEFPQLTVANPEPWWPWQYGAPHLETLRMTAALDHAESDAATIHFGIREVTAALNAKGALQFQINHRNFLIRGGGYTPDLFYREPHARLRQELDYVKHLHLNTIRLEGKLGSDDLFDLADEMGILVMPGWQCCDHWQAWGKWTAEDQQVAVASTYSQITRLRAHPSVFVWLNGSDEAPPAKIEQQALTVLSERDWPNPVLNSAADRTTTTGKSGVKMSGPYDYVPPEYWSLDHDRFGGAYGFNTETGPGPAIPLASTIRKTLPRKSWWPINSDWDFHAGLGKFNNFDVFNSAMDQTYGPAKNLDDYERKAQLMAYDGERAMFEAYSANKYNSTGVIQWMLNNSWPSFIWHLYDYNLVPGGGYFGTRKANEPLHIQYRYDDRQISVVNSTLTPHTSLKASAKLLTLNGKELFAKEQTLDLAPDGVASLFALPEQSTTTFLKLTLHDARGQLVSTNFYWLPSTLAKLNWDKTTYVNTPAFNYANMRDLASLPAAHIQATLTRDPHDALILHLHNPGTTIAFFLAARTVKPGTDEDLAPVFWSDNYVSLLPGESTTLTLTGSSTVGAEIKLEGWNVPAQTLQTTLKN